MKNVRNLLFVLTLLVAAGCQAKGPGVQDLVITMQAQTAAAASPTPLPSSTPLPTATATPIPPTLTTPPTYTPSPEPSATLTPEPTPGKLAFTDDFSQKSDIWSGCPDCIWKDGKLYMGPYEPGVDNDFHTIICDKCGERPFYRFAVDATFTEGYADRGFGLLIYETDEELMDLEIWPFQISVILKYDQKLNSWTRMRTNPDMVFNGMINPGFTTNRLEVDARPNWKDGITDYYIKINGKTSIILYGQPTKSGKVGLVVGWHTIGVAFDNFEYEELAPIIH